MAISLSNATSASRGHVIAWKKSVTMIVYLQWWCSTYREGAILGLVQDTLGFVMIAFMFTRPLCLCCRSHSNCYPGIITRYETIQKTPYLLGTKRPGPWDVIVGCSKLLEPAPYFDSTINFILPSYLQRSHDQSKPLWSL